MKFVNGKQIKTCPRCDSTNIGRTEAKIPQAVQGQKQCSDCGFKADFW